MPLLIHASAWWLLGLYVGTARAPGWSWWWLAVAGVLVWVMAWKSGEGRVPAARSRSSSAANAVSFAPLLALAGLVAAGNATRERDACRRLLLRMVSDSAVVWARLGEPQNGSFGRTSSGRASSGTVSSVRAVLSERSERPRCRVPGWLKFVAPGKASDTHDLRPDPAGNVRAGLMVAITGTACQPVVAFVSSRSVCTRPRGTIASWRGARISGAPSTPCSGRAHHWCGLC